MSEPTLLEQLLDAMEQCKILIRQAHEAQSDLRQVIKEARGVGRELQRDVFEPFLQAEVSKQVEALGAATGAQIVEARQKVIGSFERLSNLLMYGNEQGRGENLEPKIRKAAQDRRANGGIA